MTDDELTMAIRLARNVEPGTPTPSKATAGLDTEELSSLFQRAVLQLEKNLNDALDLFAKAMVSDPISAEDVRRAMDMCKPIGRQP